MTRIDECALSVCGQPWAFAHEAADAIEAHWDLRRRENPGFFNGPVHLMRDDATLEGGVLSGTFLLTDFKSFLHWRELGYPPAGVIDTFGAALIRSCEGHVLLGHQSAGHINSGLAYPPGGFIDACDIGLDGRIDMKRSIERELAEETGLDAAALSAPAHFLAARAGAQFAIARKFHSPLPSTELRAAIVRWLEDGPAPELADIVIVREVSEMDAIPSHPYARLLVAAAFAGDRR